MVYGQAPFYPNQGFNSSGYGNQQYTPQQYQQPTLNPMQQSLPMNAHQQNAANYSDDRIWVASQTAAEAYPLVPNGFVRLWDSNKPTYYEKFADASGRQYPMVIVDYSVRGTMPEQGKQPAQSPTIQEYENRIKALEDIISAQGDRISALEQQPQATAPAATTNTKEGNKK